MVALTEAIQLLAKFRAGDLTARIAKLEDGLTGKDRIARKAFLEQEKIDDPLLGSALIVKQLSSQIDNIVHAIGILALLPRILDDTESVIALSLAAGNTGKAFDLETDRRVAEFKFMHWRGGSETIRQNALFKDFYWLAEYEQDKRRELYVLDKHHPEQFFNGNRKLPLDGNRKLNKHFGQRSYGTQFVTVREYFLAHKDRVQLIDIFEVAPDLKDLMWDLPGTA